MNYKQYLLNHFNDYQWGKNGKEFRINCINPDHFRIKGEVDTHHHLYINIKTGLFICPICAWKGNFWTFVSFVEGLSWKEVYGKYKDELGSISLADFETVVEEKLYPVPVEEKVVKLIGRGYGFKVLDIDKESMAYKYLSGRGITQEKIDMYKLKYCIDGKYAFRIIIPTYENQKLVYFVARDYTSNLTGIEVLAKVTNPPKCCDQFLPKEEIVFGYDNVIGKEWVVVTEGVFDAMIVPSGVALLGKYLSEKQFFKIKNLGIKRVYVMFDSDAYNKGLEFAWKFISWGLSASVIRLVGTEDPSNIGEDECKKRINSVGELDFETYIKQYLEV